jgi:pimeloyl-ACP methyl ester carboxylesterase
MALERPMLHFLYRAIASASAAFDHEQLRTHLTAVAMRPPDVLRGLSIPTLFIVGGEDTTYPFFLSEVLASLMPSAKVELVPESGHSVYFQRAETFNQLVDRFLASAG